MQAWFNLSKYNLIQIMVIFLQNEHVFLPDNYVSMGYQNMSSKLLSTVDKKFLSTIFNYMRFSLCNMHQTKLYHIVISPYT